MVGPRSRIVVGVDGTGQAEAALEWAAAEAARRGSVLDVVYAWSPPHVMSPIGLPGPAIDDAPSEARAKKVLDDAIATLSSATRRSVYELNRISVPDRPGTALRETAKGADLLVVGTRGRGSIKGLLGSVSHECVHHATCPVIVVPPGWPSTPPKQMVVGVDGSEISAAALQWALDEAATWDAELAVTYVWKAPASIVPWETALSPARRVEFFKGSEALIDEMVDAAVMAGVPQPRAVTPVVVEDQPGPGLVRAAADADLLVVGSRGRGGFGALLVGSTSLHCLHVAECPVAIIPAPSSGRD